MTNKSPKERAQEISVLFYNRMFGQRLLSNSGMDFMEKEIQKAIEAAEAPLLALIAKLTDQLQRMSNLAGCYNTRIEELEGQLRCARKFELGNDIEIVWRGGVDSWAVMRSGHVLNDEDCWEYEPFPSSRTNEFIARTRTTLSLAMARAKKFISKDSK